MSNTQEQLTSLQREKQLFLYANAVSRGDSAAVERVKK